MIQCHGLNSRFPSDSVGGDGTARGTDGEAEGEVAVVITEAAGIEGIGSVEQADLTKHRVPVDEHPVADPQIVVPQPAGAGNVDQKVPVPQPIPGAGLAGPVKLSVRPVPINPGVRHTKIGKDFFQAAESERAVVCDRAGLRVVGPRPGILQVQHLMAEGTKPEKILEIVPDDAAERVLSDQAGDDDAHQRTLDEEEKSWKFS